MDLFLFDLYRAKFGDHIRLIRRRGVKVFLKRPSFWFAAIAIDVENIDDHRQRELVIDSGVSLDWTNERTEQFLQEHLNALREIAASEE